MTIVYHTLGAFTPQLGEQLARAEEIKSAYERIEELETVLTEARLQIEYLHAKFKATGSGEAVLARIYDAMS